MPVARSTWALIMSSSWCHAIAMRMLWFQATPNNVWFTRSVIGSTHVRAAYVRRVQTRRHRSSSSDSPYNLLLQDSSRTLVNCQDIKSCQHRSRSESASLSKREKGKIGPFRLTTHEIIGAQSGKQPAAAFLLFSCPRSRSPDYYPCLWLRR